MFGKGTKLFGLAPIYLLYWTAGAIMAGMIAAQHILPIPNQASTVMQHSAEDSEHEAMHAMLVELDPAKAPEISLQLSKDAVSGWNLFVDVTNFEFEPIGEAVEMGVGHAHLYINDVKMARLYGPYFHIPELPAGTHQIRVSLNAHNHASFAVNGQPVEAETVLEQSETPTQ